MFLSSLSIKRPVMVSMGLLVFLVFGSLAYFGLSLNMMPDVEIGFVTVQTVYPGAGPQETETQITKRIEDVVATISKIDFIRSFSMENASFVMIKFDLGKDVDIATQEVKDKVNSILSDLPEDAKLPVVQKFDMSAESIIDIILTGNFDTKTLFELADKKVKDRLSQVEGVGEVIISGGQEREIRIELENRVVYQNALSLAQLSQILAAQNMNMPAGNFEQGSQEYSVRLEGEFGQIETLKEIKLPTAFGIKKLGDLAVIEDTGSEIRERTSFFNNVTKEKNDHAILLGITKSSGGNTVEMAKRILETIPEIQKELPAGTKLTVVRDDSIYIESSVEDTLSNIFLGIVLTGLVLLFFLHDIRSTFIVAMAMPYSIISTFLLIQVSDFSLNIMTLMGLSTAVGILVANSVVVIENIFRYKEMGHGRKKAADKGTAETAVAVIASTLTNIVVFLPIASMSSMIGQFFKEFALTVTFATIFSLIASFTITPMLASLILPKNIKSNATIGKFLEKMFKSWENGYKKLLAGIVKNKKRSFGIILFSLLLFVFSMFIATKVGFEFFPVTDEGQINIEVELPQGYNIDETTALVQKIEQTVTEHEAVEEVIVSIGSISQLDVGVNLAVIKVSLIDKDFRTQTASEIASQFTQQLSTLPNAMIRASAVSSMGSGDAPVQFYVLGQDINKVEALKEQVVEKIKDIDGLVNLNTSSRPGKPEITLVPDRRKLADAGITVYDLAMTIRASLNGIVATYFREGGNEYDVRVKLTGASANSPEKIGSLTLVSQQGRYRISQLAEVKFSEGYSKILHKDKYKSVEFSAYTAPGAPLGDIVNEINARTAEIEFPAGYKLDWGGSAKMMAETAMDMLTTFIIAFLLTYMLLAAILESLTQPLMILGTVPLALIGVFVGLFITGQTMNTISMMAIVMLLGIVVNNAILLLDYTNILRKQGKSVKEALVEACPTKLKPIIMSTLAIILGMAPLALGIGSAGAEIRQPMGIISIGGLVSSALLSLFIIPALYYLTTREKKA